MKKELSSNSSLSIVWNVYDNYEDLFITSEIIEHQNQKNKYFENIYQASQGGYHKKPDKIYIKYLVKHMNLDVDENLEIIKDYKKHIGILRLVIGYKNAFNFAVSNNSKYLIITNADSNILNLNELKKILISKDFENKSIGLRKGLITGLYFTLGECIPFFDDHFILLNIENCLKHKVFDYEKLNFLDTSLHYFYGIHYFLNCFLNERVPEDQVLIYSNLTNTINHFGEYCGPSLLPLQYDLSLQLLHANTTHGSNVNILRYEYFKLFKYDNLESVKLIHNQYLKNNKNEITNSIKINKKKKYPYFKEKIFTIIKNASYLFFKNLYNYFQNYFYYNKLSKKISITKKYKYKPFKFYKRYNYIYPIKISGRYE